jgi:hypothetical protein
MWFSGRALWEARRIGYSTSALGRQQAANVLPNRLTDLNLTDMETCYKAFRPEVLQAIPLEETHFRFEPGITAKVAKRKLRIYEAGNQLCQANL